MGIEKYFVDGFELWSTTYYEENGVEKEQFTLIESFKGRLDPSGSSRTLLGDKDTYIIVQKLFCPATLAEKEGDIIKYDGVDYRVISPVNPLMKNHHKEILLTRVD